MSQQVTVTVSPITAIGPPTPFFIPKPIPSPPSQYPYPETRPPYKPRTVDAEKEYAEPTQVKIIDVKTLFLLAKKGVTAEELKALSELYGKRVSLPPEAQITGIRRVPEKPQTYEIQYVIPQKVETSPWEPIYEKYPFLAMGTFSVPKIGYVPKEYPITKRIERIRGAYPTPIREVLTFGIGAQEWLTGPSPTQATVQTIVEGVTGKGWSTKHFEKLQKYPLEYHLGSLAMDISFIYYTAPITSKAISKVWSGVKRVTPQFIKQPIAYQVKFGPLAKAVHTAKLWRIEHLPTWRTSKIDVWFAKQSAWYYRHTGGLAVGEVTIPKFERIGLKELQASFLAWEIHKAPRMGGVWIGKYLIEPTKKKVLPHLIYRAGKVSVGHLTELGFRKEVAVTPLVSQTQLTRMGVYPHIPKPVSVVTGEKITEMFAGLSVSTLLKVPQAPKRKEKEKVVVTPKVWRGTFAFEREKLTPLVDLTPKVEKKERAIPMPRMAVAPIMKPKTLERQLLKMSQIQAVQMKEINKQLQEIIEVRPPHIGLKRPKKRKGKDPFGAWFEKIHPIPSPEEMMKRLGF